jgi:hypothetical protein
MRTLTVLAFAAFTSLAPVAAAQDVIAASGAYRDLQTICAEDRGRLWGVDICGPMLVVDPATRATWASESDGAGVFSDTGAGWTGTLPADVTVANTAVEWAGRRWIMVIAPLPESDVGRRTLVAHEAWHRIQPQLGLAATRGADALHLDDEQARVLLRLEFRALATALRSRGRARRQATSDALIFRAERIAPSPAAAASEAALFRNEGLASYTGVRLGVRENPDLYAARTLDDFDTHEAYARAFAYAAGPGYGLLLDDIVPRWRTELGPYSPPDLLLNELQPRIGNRGALRQARERYGAAEVAAAEQRRAQALAVRRAELRRLYAEGPRLEAPLISMRMEFNPSQITPVPDLGSFYGRLTVRDAWGELRTEGALISTDFQRVVAANPDGTGLAGPGWSLTLSPGYQLSQTSAPGVITIVRIPDADQSP